VGLTGIPPAKLGQFRCRALGVPQVGHPRQRAAVLHLLAHLEVCGSAAAANQGVVVDAATLAFCWARRRNSAAIATAHPAADGRHVDFIEEQGDVGIWPPPGRW